MSGLEEKFDSSGEEEEEEEDTEDITEQILGRVDFGTPPAPPPSPQPTGFRCPVCYRSRARPCALECGHLFCLSCAETALSVSNACPLCRRRPNRIVVREVFIENAHEEGEEEEEEEGPPQSPPSSLDGVSMALQGCGVHVFAALLRAFTMRNAPRQIVRSLFTVIVVYSYSGDHTYLQFLNTSGPVDEQLYVVLGQRLPRFTPLDPPDSLMSVTSMQYGHLAKEIIETYGAFLTRWAVLGVLEYMLDVSEFDQHEQRVASFIESDRRLQRIPNSLE